MIEASIFFLIMVLYYVCVTVLIFEIQLDIPRDIAYCPSCGSIYYWGPRNSRTRYGRKVNYRDRAAVCPNCKVKIDWTNYPQNLHEKRQNNWATLIFLCYPLGLILVLLWVPNFQVLTWILLIGGAIVLVLFALYRDHQIKKQVIAWLKQK